MDNAEAWAALGDLLLKRRIELGHPKRAPFAEAAGFRNDRVLFDLEKGRRDNYDPATLALVERAYQWQPGAIEAFVSRGVDPAPSGEDSAVDAVFAGAVAPALFGTPTSREEAAGRLRAVSDALQQAWQRTAEIQLELAQATAALQRLQDEASELSGRRERLSAEQGWLNRLLIRQTGDRTWVLDDKSDFDLVADDAGGYDHETEDEDREIEP